MHWVRLLAYITGQVDQGLLLRNEYPAAENRIFKAQLNTPLRLTDALVNPSPGTYPNPLHHITHALTMSGSSGIAGVNTPRVGPLCDTIVTIYLPGNFFEVL